MQASGGLVTITPAGKKEKYTNVDPVEVEIEWDSYGDTVEVYTSFDDFQTPTALEPEIDENETVVRHVGVLKLPPGRYLIRFYVDEDWQVDGTQEVVCSLGNEYNSLVVDDPNALDAEDEDDDKDDDEDEFADLDDQLPESFISGTSGLFNSSVDASTGMVTITPEAGKDDSYQVKQGDEVLSIEEKKKIIDAGNVEVVHGRHQSVVWDVHKRQFVVSTEDAESEAGDAIEEVDLSKLTPEEREAHKREKIRERRRRKKKRQRQRRKKQAARAAAIGAGRARAESQSEISSIKDELVKREREWREAWVLHNMKMQESREREKEAIRTQWAEERETWIIKIKQHANESNELRVRLNEVRRQLDEAQSGAQLNESASRRLQDQVASETKTLRDQIDQYKADNTQLKTELNTVREQHDAALKGSDSEKASQRAELTAARDAESKVKSELEVVRSELSNAQGELEQVKAARDTDRTEFEAKIEDMKKDAELAASQSQQAAADTASSIEAKLNARVEELNAKIDQKDKQLAEVRGQLEAANKATADAKHQTSIKQSELDAASKALEDARAQLAESQAQIDKLSERADQLTLERKAADQQAEKRVAELQGAVEDLRSQVSDKQKAADEALNAAEKAQTDLRNKEADFEREREELQRKLASVNDTRAALASRVTTLNDTTKALRANLSQLREQQNKYTGDMRRSFGDTTKFLTNAVKMQSDMLEMTMTKYKKELSDRRKYFNMVQELRGNIRVFCRARPMLPSDTEKMVDNKVAIDTPDNQSIKIVSEKRTSEYEFDRVFSTESNQTNVFKEVQPLVVSCMDGYNVCIFAYGQTGSGKTHTMEGPGDDRGVNFRALKELFKVRDQRAGDFEYKISVSMLEIYNEKIRDLLGDSKADETSSLKIHKGPQGMYVESLTEKPVETEEDVIRAMNIGHKNRSTGGTNMNAHSSRSHALLSVYVRGTNHSAGISYFGKLHLIDLAGSERLSRSGASGDRLKEAQAINKSLSALGDVIESLQSKQKHTPYRNSKLTYLLADSLGGHAKTLMFINVSPCLADAEETFCSLNFAKRVAQVELGKATASRKKVRPDSKGSNSDSAARTPTSARRGGSSRRGAPRGRSSAK
jgi:kinesin family member C2/C3